MLGQRLAHVHKAIALTDIVVWYWVRKIALYMFTDVTGARLRRVITIVIDITSMTLDTVNINKVYTYQRIILVCIEFSHHGVLLTLVLELTMIQIFWHQLLNPGWFS
jgi:hypothetical protein